LVHIVLLYGVCRLPPAFFRGLHSSAGITTLKAASNSPGKVPSCIVTSINRPWLVALYVYSALSSSSKAKSEDSPLLSAMVFDTFIMIACLWGLWRSKPRSGGRARELYKLLWSDGLMYFICASVANAFPGELSFGHSSNLLTRWLQSLLWALL